MDRPCVAKRGVWNRGRKERPYQACIENAMSAVARESDILLYGLSEIYSFTRSNCDFLGITSSIWGASCGYVSQTLALMARWTEDLTLDFAPAEMLVNNVS